MEKNATMEATKQKKGSNFTQYAVVIAALVVLVIMFSALSPSFRTYTTIVTMTSYMYYILFMAIGVTFPLITGGVDLAMGTGLVCYSIVASVTIKNMGLPVWVGFIICIVFGLLIGLLNGVIVAYFELPPFLTTLCTMMIVRGLGSIITGGVSGLWPQSGEGSWCRSIFKVTLGNGLIFPLGVIWAIILIAIMHIILHKTRIGRYIIAIGSNKEALRLSGVPVMRWHIMAYLISGFFTGLAAIAYGCTFTTLTPGTGAGFEMDAIAGAIIGGTSMAGGKGTVIGTLLGVILISLLKTGLPFIGLQANWQQIITGVIIIFAVTIDMARNHK
ncbi:MAG: ABC transporter permease [Butyricicoccus sp.]